MTAFATITLDDGQSTPVAVDFQPSSIDSNGVAHLYAAETSGLDSRRQISLGIRLPKNGSPVARVTGKVVIPVMDSDDDTVKIGDAIANVEFVIPKTSDGSLRSDLLAFLRNFLDDPSFVAAVESLESIY